MSHYNSFLPTGGAEYQPNIPSSRSSRTSSSISPRSVPRRVPRDYMSPPPVNHHHHHLPAQSKPLSPPQSRSPSAENASAALLEDWRTYTANLRSQYQGERAHLMADRGRMEECMDEERQLWELERSYFVAQVAELEAKLDEMSRRTRSLERRLQGPTSQPTSASSSSPGGMYKPSNAFGSRSRSTSRHDSSSPNYVPQESGRDADGFPFYAPAPRNPSRTFGSTEASNLSIDSIARGSGDGMIQVSNKELKASDFERTTGTQKPDPVSESIDISVIEPELEGVPLKASAISPSFTARVRSPSSSPEKPQSRSEQQQPETSLEQTTNQQSSRHRSSSNAVDRNTQALEIASAPENRRLTLNAGHTPSHSISKIAWLNEDGDATPRQHVIHKGAIDRRASMALSLASTADEDDQGDDGDKELSGPLGLTNEPITDNPFLAALTEKLEEVQRSLPTSPSDSDASSNTTTTSGGKNNQDEEDNDDEGPILKIRPSMNFGRPMGSM